MHYYPNNVVTRYTTRLKTIKELPGKWEVALTEISFPKSWLTVSKKSSRLELIDNLIQNMHRIETSPHLYLMKNMHNVEARPHLPPPNVDAYLTPGYYTTVLDLVDEMNRSIALSIGLSIRPIFLYDEKNHKVCVLLQPHTTLNLDRHLANILGFHDSTINNFSNEVERIEATAVSDIAGCLQRLYVYTDVIENTLVGDAEVPLLRVVETHGKFEEVIHQSFALPSYVPLRKKSFDSIEIDIKDVYDNPVSFENGVVVVMLHFRSASYQK